MGCVLIHMCSRMYSDGGFLTRGSSLCSFSQVRSSRHMSGIIQANPPSIRTNLRLSKISNSPWLTMLVTWDWKLCAIPAWSSM